jgi:hypothetical protein
MSRYIKPFSKSETQKAVDEIRSLAISLQGRKLEEGDWTNVYCKVRGVAPLNWSNLPFRDYIHNGVGVEFKLLQRKNPIADVGRSLMHPSATRTISFDENESAEVAKRKVLTQWSEQIHQFELRVAKTSKVGATDIRWGILLWKPDHTQFLYFEERLIKPNPSDYDGRWHDGQHRGKATRNLHIYERATGEKKFSCTLPRNGAKLQPYFNVPSETEGAVHFALDKADLVPLFVSDAVREGLLKEFPNKSDNEIVQNLLAAYHREKRT